jgi:hypothetical protein
MNVGTGWDSNLIPPEYIPADELVQFIMWMKFSKHYGWKTVYNIIAALTNRKKDHHTQRYASNMWSYYDTRDTSVPIKEPDNLAENLVIMTFPTHGTQAILSLIAFYEKVKKEGYGDNWAKYIDEHGDNIQVSKVHQWFVDLLVVWYLNDIIEPSFEPNIMEGGISCK